MEILANDVIGNICNLTILESKVLKESKECILYKIVNIDKKKYIIKHLLSENRNERMFKEIAVCKHIKEQVSEFPCVIPLKCDCSMGMSIYLQEYLDGESYFNVISTSDEKKEFSKELIKKLVLLRNIQIDKLLKQKIFSCSNKWKDYLLKQMAMYKLEIDKNSNLSYKQIDNAYSWFVMQSERLENIEKISLIHNDLNKDNIVVVKEKGKITIGLLDFERAILGDSLKDVSKLIWIFRRDKELGDLFWKEYTAKSNKTDYIRLKMYLCFDIFNHLSQYDVLCNDFMWRNYICEELDILKYIEKDEFKLW